MPSQPQTWDSGNWDSGTWPAEAPNQNTNMPIQNISAEFTVAALAALKAAIEALNPQFPALVTLTEDERKSLQRVGAGRESFCETANTGAVSFPTVVPAYMSKAEWDKDENYFTQLEELEVPLAALLQKVRDTKAAVGAERYRQARKFYEAVKSAKDLVPGLQALYLTLSEQFDGQGGDGSDDEPPADGGGTTPPTP